MSQVAASNFQWLEADARNQVIFAVGLMTAIGWKAEGQPTAVARASC